MGEDKTELWLAIAQAMMDGTAKTPGRLPPELQEFFLKQSLQGGYGRPAIQPGTQPVPMEAFPTPQGGLLDQYRQQPAEPWADQQGRMFERLRKGRQ